MMNPNCHLTLVSECFPEIGKRISIIWGNDCLDDYLHILLKQPYLVEVSAALMALHDMHHVIFPRDREPQ